MKLLKDNFEPGDKLVETRPGTSQIIAQAFITKEGKKLLLINKINKDINLTLPNNFKGATASVVDVSTGDDPPAQHRLQENNIILKPFSVMVVKINK